jgi:hypothetical protein
MPKTLKKKRTLVGRKDLGDLHVKVFLNLERELILYHNTKILSTHFGSKLIIMITSSSNYSLQSDSIHVLSAMEPVLLMYTSRRRFHSMRTITINKNTLSASEQDKRSFTIAGTELIL